MGYTVKKTTIRTFFKRIFSPNWENDVIHVEGDILNVCRGNGQKKIISINEIDERRVDVLEKGLYSTFSLLFLTWLLGLVWVWAYYGIKYALKKIIKRPNKKVIRKITYYSKGEELFSIHTKMKNAERLEAEIGFCPEQRIDMEEASVDEMPEEPQILQHFTEENEAQKYLDTNLKGKKNRGIIVLIVALLAWIALTSTIGDDDLSEAKRFDRLKEDSRTVYYEDIVLVSKSAYQLLFDDYYLAQNPEGQWLIVCLDDETFEALELQHEYYLKIQNGEIATQPEPVRVYGISVDSSLDFENVIDEMGKETFEAYFGTCYLDATTTPRKDTMQKSWLVTISLLIGTVIYVIVRFTKTKKRKQSLQLLEEKGLLLSAADELYACGGLSVKNGTKCSPHFLYSSRLECVIPVGDIIWYYRLVLRREEQEKLIVYTKTTQNMEVCVVGTRKTSKKNGNMLEDINDLSKQIRRYNPNVLQGYSEENKQEYQRKIMYM